MQDVLNAGTGRCINSETKVGLYIELRDYQTNLDTLGIDMAEALDTVLKANKLDTIADCQDKLPIIVQSFEIPALNKFATLSDLPLVYLFRDGESFDWDEVSEKFHGVGPPSDIVVNPPGSITGDTNNSDFINQVHALGLAVHPWTF